MKLESYVAPILLGIVLLALNSCTTNPSSPPNASVSTVSADIIQRWDSWYQKWRGTPYRYGGTNQSGIDCSALIQDAYRSIYQMQIPRTTRQQRTIGFRVAANQLQVGDLLFFQPKGNNNHVGVYIGKQRFIHASSSKGVIISALDNPYWIPRLVQARRLIP